MVLDEIREARILHCDHNIPELYLEHAQRTTFNANNVNVPINLQTYVSSTDTTWILGTIPTILDPDYLPPGFIKSDPIEPSGMQGSMSLSKDTDVTSYLQTTIKCEPAESMTEILDSHSPQCKLRMQITNIISLRQEYSPTDNTEYSTDSTIVGGILTPQAHVLNSSTLQLDDDSQLDTQCSISYTDMAQSLPTVSDHFDPFQDITGAQQDTLQDVTNTATEGTIDDSVITRQDKTEPGQDTSQDVTNTINTTSDVNTVIPNSTVSQDVTSSSQQNDAYNPEQVNSLQYDMSQSTTVPSIMNDTPEPINITPECDTSL